MRLAAWKHNEGDHLGIHIGIVDGGDVVPCDADALGGASTIRAVLENDVVSRVTSALREQDRVPLSKVQLQPPIADPQKILCIGLNYRSHQEEANWRPDPYPTVFTRFADTQVGHDQAIVHPSVSENFDYEGELAVVIGQGGFRIPEESAMDHVAGYSCYNDASVRDWQFHASQWVPGKNFPATGGFGPWLTLTDEVDDITSCQLTTRVNGEVRQSAAIADLIFGIPELVAYVSTFTRLLPGDVFVTGTPAGVGFFSDPPKFLVPGDVVEVEIDGVGLLRNQVAGER